MEQCSAYEFKNTTVHFSMCNVFDSCLSLCVNAELYIHFKLIVNNFMKLNDTSETK